MSTDSTRRRAFVDNDDVLSVAHAPGASIVTMVFSTLFSPNQMLGSPSYDPARGLEPLSHAVRSCV